MISSQLCKNLFFLRTPSSVMGEFKIFTTYLNSSVMRSLLVSIHLYLFEWYIARLGVENDHQKNTCYDQRDSPTCLGGGAHIYVGESTDVSFFLSFCLVQWHWISRSNAQWYVQLICLFNHADYLGSKLNHKILNSNMFWDSYAHKDTIAK